MQRGRGRDGEGSEKLVFDAGKMEFPAVLTDKEQCWNLLWVPGPFSIQKGKQRLKAIPNGESGCVLSYTLHISVLPMAEKQPLTHQKRHLKYATKPPVGHQSFCSGKKTQCTFFPSFFQISLHIKRQRQNKQINTKPIFHSKLPSSFSSLSYTLTVLINSCFKKRGENMLWKRFDSCFQSNYVVKDLISDKQMG